MEMPRMTTAILIDQHNLYDLVKLEDKGIAVCAVDEWIHNDILRS
jgi:hypothetical protein